MPFVEEGQADVLVGPLKMTLPSGTMPPDEIKLWAENPRIAHIVGRLNHAPTDPDLIAAIRESGQNVFTDLRRDIERFGQSVPVFIKALYREGGQIQSAVVFEGATRVSVLKELHQRDPRNAKFAIVKAYLLPDNFSDKNIAILLANYHVKRALHRNPWNRYQIGSFLYHEIEQEGRFTQTEMAEQMGMSPAWVNRHLVIYRFALEYRDYLESEHGLPAHEAETQTAEKLSLLEEAYKQRSFRERFDYDDDAKPTLFKWLFEKKFTDHRKIRAIDEIYANERVRTEVETGGAEVGDAVAGRMGSSHPLHEDLDRITKRAKDLSIAELDAVDERRLDAAIAALQRLREMLSLVRR